MAILRSCEQKQRHTDDGASPEELLATRSGAVFSGADRILPQAEHRANAGWARVPVSFRAGCEMQHDTSPHEVDVGGRKI